MSAQGAINVRNKVSDLQSKLSHAAKQSLDRRFGALYDKIYREDVILEAWKRVKANKGAPGVDRQDNITCPERGAILRPCLDCELKCGTVDRFDGEDNVRVYGDPALTKPNRESSGNGAAIGPRTRTVPNYH